jgi:uncharacterized protein involved in outer membrane biogenesis
VAAEAGSKGSSGLGKKIAIAAAGVVAVLVVAMAVIPLFIDVDKYRPQIVEAAGEHLNGKLELGKLKLSLWGQIKVVVGGLKVLDSAGHEVLGVDEAYLHLPFSSFFSGSPSATFQMKEPRVSVVKNKAGVMNVMTLVKGSGTAAPPSTGTGRAAPPATGAGGAAPPANPNQPKTDEPKAAQTPPPAPAGGGKTSLPAMAMHARLSIELDDATVNYVDQGTGLNQKVKDLDLALRDISLTEPLKVEMTARLSTVMGQTFRLDGPVRLHGIVTPQFEGSEFKKVSAELEGDMKGLAMEAPGTFAKKAGDPLGFSLKVQATPTLVTIENASLKFHDAVITATGRAERPPQGDPKADIQITSNDIGLASWADLLPMLKAYELKGFVKLQAKVQGPASALQYQAMVDARDVSLKGPGLKARPDIKAHIEVVTDQLKTFRVEIRAPGNELAFNASVKNFAHPDALVQVQSSGLDLDQLLDMKPPAGASSPAKAAAKTEKTAEKPSEKAEKGEKTTETAETAAAGKSAGVPAAEDYDHLLDSLRSNAFIKGVHSRMEADLSSVSAYGVKIAPIRLRAHTEGLKAAVDDFAMQVFDGRIHSKFQTDLAPAQPTYSFDMGVDGLDLKKAVESQLHLFKDTVYGKASLQASGNGSSFVPAKATRNLKMQGKLRVDKAAFATLDVTKMALEAVNKGIAGVASKIPGLKGKTVTGKLDARSAYEYVGGTFTIADGKFHAPDFATKAEPNKGIDLSGDTQLNLENDHLNAKWWVIDTFGLLGACFDLPPAKHLLCSGPFKVPVGAEGPLSNLSYSYLDVPEYLGKIALENMAGGAKTAVVNKVTSSAKKALGKSLKKLFH